MTQPEITQEMIEDLAVCPMCGFDQAHQYLGTLGNLMHYRCRLCGVGFHAGITDTSPQPQEDA